MRKLIIVASAIAVFMAPAGASGNWQQHSENLFENRQINLTGTFEYHGEIGGVTCQLDSNVTLLHSSTTASVTSFEVDLTEAGSTTTSKCSVDATTAAFGCTDVASMTRQGFPWTAHATSTQRIAITTGTIQFHLHGGIFCPKTKQLTPDVININMSTAQTWTDGDLEGEVEVHGPPFGSQDVVVTGDVGVSPKGKYGVG